MYFRVIYSCSANTCVQVQHLGTHITKVHISLKFNDTKIQKTERMATHIQHVFFFLLKCASRAILLSFRGLKKRKCKIFFGITKELMMHQRPSCLSFFLWACMHAMNTFGESFVRLNAEQICARKETLNHYYNKNAKL